MMRKWIAMVLALLMLCTVGWMPAYAAEGAEGTQQENSTVETDTPEAAESPAVSEEPTEAETPTETEEPTEAETPTETEEPNASETPTETEEPTETEAPVPLTGLKLKETELTLRAGESQRLTLLPEPEDAVPETLVWTSEDPEIAGADENGTVTAIDLGTTTITVQAGAFSASCTVTVILSDVVESDYFYDAVYWALKNGVTTGTAPGVFSPNWSCTRAQAVTFLYRINGSPEILEENPFKDVSKNAYYADAVMWAHHVGIVQGTSATTFSPDNPCTRGQIITMLWRCRREKPASTGKFRDVAFGSYSYIPVNWGAGIGVTKGTSANTFSPNDVCTRAQIVTMLWRCADKQYAIYDKSAWQVPYPNAAAVLDQVGWDLRSAFKWSVGMTYYHDEIPISAGSEKLADYGFSNHKGDCYVYAATFYTMAIDLGYDAHQVWGYVPQRGGGKVTHSWVEIEIGGSTYVFDPDFQYATGSNGFQIHYGQSGTWMYMDYYRIN